VSQNEIVKSFVLPSLSLSNKIIWKVSILAEEVGVGHILRNLKPYYCNNSNRLGLKNFQLMGLLEEKATMIALRLKIEKF
jgi:hypothetical protein